MLRFEWCVCSFPASDAGHASNPFFSARPGNILNIGTAIKAVVYMKYLEVLYFSYFLEVGLSVSNAGHLLKMSFHKFEL